MLVLQIASAVLLLAACAAHDKKIELQDIEEDNLKSEKSKNEYEKSDAPSTSSGSDRDMLPLEFLKNGLLKYFNQPAPPQQPRYVHQYAVNEPAEKVLVNQKPQMTAPSGPQQAMVGYYSNVPMQIYLVPQYYGEHDQQLIGQPGIQYAAPSQPARVAYSPQEPVNTQQNFIEVPNYVMPTGKTYVPQYQQYQQPQVTYVTYTQPPTAAAAQMVVTAPTVNPGLPQTSLLTYQMPTYQYPTNLVSPPLLPKENYQTAQFETTNTVEEPLERETDGKHYTTATATQPEATYPKLAQAEYPRYYASRTPSKDEHGHSSIPELPAPNPSVYRPHAHLAHLPKALPMYRPFKPVYNPAAYIPNVITPRPIDYPYAIKKRPSSLLNSYIPSSVQLEYMKRGYARDPLAAYDALSSGRGLHPAAAPRQLERGFLPNQMYHTAAGGITFGHYKRTPKTEGNHT